jgi:DNA-binding beta-propeller fold protein YncE
MKSTNASPILHEHRRSGRFLAATLSAGLLALTAALAFASAASAAAPDLLFQTPAEGVEGPGAGQLSNPRGIATDPTSGHIYVSDQENARIDEFTAWGVFVKAWGWGVADGTSELQSCGPEAIPPTATCQKGIAGRSSGQLGDNRKMAVDAAGDIYVGEERINGECGCGANFRVQKFDPEGHFLLMFGGEVDKTTKANVCTKASDDVCGNGVEGSGKGEFSDERGGHIAYDPITNSVFVGDRERIEEFDTDGNYKAQIPLPQPGSSVSLLAADPVSGDLYVGLVDTSRIQEPNVYRLDPATGEVIEPILQLESPLQLAVDRKGDVYAVDDPPGGAAELEPRVLEFDPAGAKLLPTKEEEDRKEFFPSVPFDGPVPSGLATNVIGPGSEAPGDLYVSFFKPSGASYISAYGPSPFAFEDPPKRPPEIRAQYATSVGGEEATLKAQINPHFWPDATYYLQYGTGKCSEGGCGAQKPLAPGSTLTAKSLNAPVDTAGVFLSGLEPGTTYHYRFATKSSGSDGETVFGVGGKPGEDGEEGTFTTFPAPTQPAPCPANEAFRTGASGKLPDCRAYELVSPLDKEDGDAGLLASTATFFEVNQSATSGDRFTYSSMSAFSGAESAPYVSQYLASREAGAGWSNQAISPPRSMRPLVANRSLHNDFKGFSADLCESWLQHNSVSTLAEGAIPGYPNLYRRQDCGVTPSYEALSTVKPPNRPARQYSGLGVLGFSANGAKTIFVSEDKLTEDAPTLNAGLGEDIQAELLLYEHSASGLRYVCYLPSGNPSQTACGAGLSAGQPDARASAVENAISADGSRVFWTAYSGTFTTAPTGISGKLYVRLNPDQEQSKLSGGGKCTEAEKACTIAVSGSVSPEPAQYWSASEDGSKALFKIMAGTLKDNLYEFDVATKKPRLIAEGVQGPMGASEDASHVYFASSKLLGEGASEGAEEGAHNLYLYEAGEEGGQGSFHFIMVLSGEDFTGSELRPATVSEVPNVRSATLSPDGRHAAFTSSASPAPGGYDNLDAASGEADQEAYLYDATQHELRCVSCNPTGARPAGKDLGGGSSPLWVAAQLPNRRIPLHAPQTLAEDGSRLFFESHEALVPRDSNGTWDVYEWEAVGSGSCEESNSTYSEASEGCVDLISSGESPSPSRFLDADPSGRDVFIGTQSSLIGADYGLSDVYDARVDGGLPEPSLPPAACEGEACQGPISAPDDPTPASSSFEGAGNVKEAPKASCAKPKIARKGRCVAKKHHKRAKKAKHSRRAGR